MAKCEKQNVLTKNYLSKLLASKINVSVAQASMIVHDVLNIMSEHLSEGGRIEFRDFGIFEIIERKGGIGRNPKHPEKAILIPPHKTIKFHAGKNLAKRVE